MPDFKKTIATAKAKVADAETQAFMATLDAIDPILQDAKPNDVAMLCATPSRTPCRSAARRTRTSSRRISCEC